MVPNGRGTGPPVVLTRGTGPFSWRILGRTSEARAAEETIHRRADRARRRSVTCTSVREIRRRIRVAQAAFCSWKTVGDEIGSTDLGFGPLMERVSKTCALKLTYGRRKCRLHHLPASCGRGRVDGIIPDCGCSEPFPTLGRPPGSAEADQASVDL